MISLRLDADQQSDLCTRRRLSRSLDTDRHQNIDFALDRLVWLDSRVHQSNKLVVDRLDVSFVRIGFQQDAYFLHDILLVRFLSSSLVCLLQTLLDLRLHSVS